MENVKAKVPSQNLKFLCNIWNYNHIKNESGYSLELLEASFGFILRKRVAKRTKPKVLAKEIFTEP